VAIDDSGAWWVGSEAEDIEPYLRAYTESEGCYVVSAFRLVHCGCGSNRFRLERAGEIARRECVACGSKAFTCRVAEDWEEAVEEEGAESYTCVECRCEEANIGIGFARYDEAPELDAIKWYYVGVRCVACGILGCFSDGKVGRGPAEEVYQQA
jgi:hypothetical protein